MGLAVLWLQSYRWRAASAQLPLPASPPSPCIREQHAFGESGYRQTCPVARGITNSTAIWVRQGICLKKKKQQKTGPSVCSVPFPWKHLLLLIYPLPDFPNFDKDSSMEKYFPIRKTPGQVPCIAYTVHDGELDWSWATSLLFLCSGGYEGRGKVEPKIIQESSTWLLMSFIFWKQTCFPSWHILCSQKTVVA